MPALTVARRPALDPELDCLHEPAALQDPFPLLKTLREQAPVAYSHTLDTWVVSSHQHARHVLHGPDVFASFPDQRTGMPAQPPPWLAGYPELRQVLTTPNITNSDGQLHRHIRQAAKGAFTLQAVAALEPFLRQTVDSLLAPHIRAGRLDLVHDVARPLPLALITELMGIPPHDRERVRAWSDALVAALEPGVPSPDVLASGDNALGELRRHVRGMISQRRAQPGDDLVSRLLTVDHPLFDEDAFVDTCSLLLTAGHASSTGLLGNLAHALLTHPEQLQAVRDDPALLAGAIDETLRWNPPNKRMRRVALTTAQLGDATIPAGDELLVLLAAANRDPVLVDDPDRFDLRRPLSRHLAFGAGPHHCIAVRLARKQAAATLTALLQLPRLRLPNADSQPRWEPSLLLRTLESLPLEFDTNA